MLKSEFIFQQALLEAIPETTGIAGKERANIIRAKVLGSSLYSKLEEEYKKLLGADDIKNADEVIKHNQDVLDFRKKLLKETVDLEPIKLTEKTFEALCGKINKPATLELIIDKREVSDDDLLAYIYSTLIM